MLDSRTITKIVHGSKLYGTNTPKSDNDFKSVFVPSAQDILLGNVKRVKETNTKTDKTQKNTLDDVDDSSYALAKFLKLVTDGDTSGVEILLAPKEFRLITSPEFDAIYDVKDKLLNRKSRGFVGYCRTQSQKYGVKGSRLKVAKEAMTLFSKFGGKRLVGDMDEEIKQLVANNDHCSITIITTPSGVEVPHVNICDRKVPYTVPAKVAYELYRSVYDNYGERARQAAENSNVDWKAVSHAVRVGEQAIELLNTGNLTFPRPNAEYLKAIKLGQVEYAKVADELEKMLDTVEVVAKTSSLPETSDMGLVDDLITHFHKLQIVGTDDNGSKAL